MSSIHAVDSEPRSTVMADNNQIGDTLNPHEAKRKSAQSRRRPHLMPKPLKGFRRETLHRDHPLLTSSKARGWKGRVARFTSSWYSVSMGTGMVSTLLFNVPFATSHAVLRGIATAFLVMNMGLFLAFTVIYVLRFILYSQIFRVLMLDDTQSLFLGCIPMSFATIVSGIATISDSYALGPRNGLDAILAAAAMWWVAMALALTTALGVPWLMFTRHNHAVEKLTAAWILPIVPTITVSSVGSVLVKRLMDSHPSYALVILITSYALLGIGLLLSIMILTTYFLRLVIHHLPPREVMISTFLPLGPCGQGGFALVELGRCSRDLFEILRQTNAEGSTGVGGDAVKGLGGVGEAMYGTGLVWGFLFWGLGMWWWFIAVMSVGTSLLDKTIAFNMGWWAFTFPLGSLTLLTFSLAQSFDALFFKVLGTIMSTLVVFIWIAIAIPTIKGFVTGSLFQAPCLTRLPSLSSANDTGVGTEVTTIPSPKLEPLNEQKGEQIGNVV